MGHTHPRNIKQLLRRTSEPRRLSPNGPQCSAQNWINYDPLFINPISSLVQQVPVLSGCFTYSWVHL